MRLNAPGPKRLTPEELAPAWRDDSQLAVHIILALPWPFTEGQHISTTRAFIERELLPHGFVCQFAVHPPDEDSPLNWYSRMLVLTRKIVGREVGNKIRGIIAEFANKAGGGGHVSHERDRAGSCLTHSQMRSQGPKQFDHSRARGTLGKIAPNCSSISPEQPRIVTGRKADNPRYSSSPIGCKPKANKAARLAFPIVSIRWNSPSKSA